MEDFWRDDGARFLVSTSAGGEGINLQIGRILFNYDLPFVDALLTVSLEPAFMGEIARLDDGGTIVARYLVRYEDDDHRPTARVITLEGRPDGRVESVEWIEWLGNGAVRSASKRAAQRPDIAMLADRFEEVKNSIILDWIPDRHRRARVTSQIVGLHCR